jgi:hypothetical protein
VSNTRARVPEKEVCGLCVIVWDTACHSHVIQLVVDTPAKCLAGGRCQINAAVFSDIAPARQSSSVDVLRRAGRLSSTSFRPLRNTPDPLTLLYSVYLHQLAINFHERKRRHMQKFNHISPEGRYYTLNLPSCGRCTCPHYTVTSTVG